MNRRCCAWIHICSHSKAICQKFSRTAAFTTVCGPFVSQNYRHSFAESNHLALGMVPGMAGGMVLWTALEMEVSLWTPWTSSWKQHHLPVVVLPALALEMGLQRAPVASPAGKSVFACRLQSQRRADHPSPAVFPFSQFPSAPPFGAPASFARILVAVVFFLPSLCRQSSS